LYLRQRSSKSNKEIAGNIPFPSVQINVCSAHGNHSPGTRQLHREGTLQLPYRSQNGDGGVFNIVNELLVQRRHHRKITMRLHKW